jgi:hypothetical protein
VSVEAEIPPIFTVSRGIIARRYGFKWVLRIFKNEERPKSVLCLIWINIKTVLYWKSNPNLKAIESLYAVILSYNFNTCFNNTSCSSIIYHQSQAWESNTGSQYI